MSLDVRRYQCRNEVAAIVGCTEWTYWLFLSQGVRTAKLLMGQGASHPKAAVRLWSLESAFNIGFDLNFAFSCSLFSRLFSFAAGRDA